jgi:hypothetical protein
MKGVMRLKNHKRRTNKILFKSQKQFNNNNKMYLLSLKSLKHQLQFQNQNMLFKRCNMKAKKRFNNQNLSM